MSIPIHSTSDILAALREHPEWRDEVRRELLTEELLTLPTRLATLEARMEEGFRRVWEAIGKLTERVDQLAEAQQRTEVTLKSFMEATEKRFAEVDATLKRHEVLFGEIRGDLLQDRIERNPQLYVREIADSVAAVKMDEMDRILETAKSTVTPQEARAVRALDLVLRGKREGKGVFLAVEASCAIGQDDVERASVRAAILAKAVAANPRMARILVLPVAIGHAIVPAAREAARRHNVWTVVGEERETSPGGY